MIAMKRQLRIVKKANNWVPTTDHKDENIGRIFLKETQTTTQLN